MATPYVNFRGSDDFRFYNISGLSKSTGVRINSDTGRVYVGNFGSFSTAEIVELDPSTNGVRMWPTSNHPYFLVIDGKFVYATAVAGADFLTKSFDLTRQPTA